MSGEEVIDNNNTGDTTAATEESFDVSGILPAGSAAEADAGLTTADDDDVKPAETTAETPEAKTVEATNETDEADDKKTEETPVVEATKPKPVAQKRDYSGFDPEDAKILSDAPNKTFNMLKERLPLLYAERDKAKQLEQQLADLKHQTDGKTIPQQWQEHPEAYTLSPEYKLLTKQYQQADFEENYWRKSLVDIEQDGQWTPLKGYDAQGQPIFGQPIAATPEAKIALLQTLTETSRIKEQTQDKAKTMQESFKTNYTQAQHNLEQFADEKIKTLIPEIQPKKEHEDIFIQALPKAFQGHPVSQFAAKLFSIVINQGTMLKTYRDKEQRTSKNQRDARRAGPKLANGLAGTSKGNADDFFSVEGLM